MIKKSVEVSLSGGIGNQLFQFAAGLSLCSQLDAELVLNLSWYGRKTSAAQRKMQLHYFVEVDKFQTHSTSIHPTIDRMKRIAQGYKIVNEAEYDPERFLLIRTNRNVVMNGYWQSERYFSAVSSLLRASIKQDDFTSKSANDLAESIKSSKCIGIHVRRGDYVTDPKTRAVHGVCDRAYFLDAVRFIKERNEVDSLIVFSDDTEWCQNNLEFEFRTKIIDESICDVDQLKLLSLCGHHIISNSSFSWWAAWLGSKPEQNVVYPTSWFADGRALESMPAGWIEL